MVVVHVTPGNCMALIFCWKKKNGAPFGNTEVVLPPTKRTKMDPAFGVPLINNANLDRLTQKMVHPCSSEALSELLQQP